MRAPTRTGLSGALAIALAASALVSSACGGAGSTPGAEGARTPTAPPAAADPLEALAQALVQRGDGVAYSPAKQLYAYAVSWQNASGGEGRRVVFSTEDGREAQAIGIFEPADPSDKPLEPALLAVRAALLGGRFMPLDRVPWPDGAPELDAGPFRLRLDAAEVVAVRPSGRTIRLAPLVPHAPGEIRPIAIYLSAAAPLMLLEVEHRPLPGAAGGNVVSNAFGLLRPP